MRIEVNALKEALRQDIGTMQNKLDQWRTQQNMLWSVASGDSSLKGEAYTNYFNYLSNVKLPVVFLQNTLFSDYISDMQNDTWRLQGLSPDAAGVVDTSSMNLQIENLKQQNYNLQAWAQDYRELLPWADSYVNRIVYNNNSVIQRLAEQVYKVDSYSNDGTIYATSLASSATLDAATKALNEVVFDDKTHSFDTSGISDWSWSKSAGVVKFWEEYNQRTLELYFVFDEDGNIIGVTPDWAKLAGDVLFAVRGDDIRDFERGLDDAAKALLSFDENGNIVWSLEFLEKLFRLGPNGALDMSVELIAQLLRAGNPFDGEAYIDINRFSELEAGLSPNEKYVLLYVVKKYGPAAFNLESTAAKNAYNALKGLLPAGTLPEDFGSGKAFDLGPITQYFSFIWRDGKFIGGDSPDSVQANSGFMDHYDFATKFLGMDVETRVVVFRYEGFEYRLQEWEGQYMAGLTVGGEVGLYRRPASEADDRPYIPKDFDNLDDIDSMSPADVDNYYINYSSLSEKQQIPMEIKITADDIGALILANDTADYAKNGDHYWNFACIENKGQKYKKDNIHLESTLTITDPGMFAALDASLTQQGIKHSSQDAKITIEWGKQQ